MKDTYVDDSAETKPLLGQGLVPPSISNSQNQTDLTEQKKSLKKSCIEEIEELTGRRFKPSDYIMSNSDMVAITIQSVIGGAMAYAWTTFSVFIARAGGVPYSYYAIFMLADTVGGMLGPFFIFLAEDLSYRWTFLISDLFTVVSTLLFLLPIENRFFLWCGLMFLEGVLGAVEDAVGMMFIGKCSGSAKRAIQFMAFMEFADTMSLMFMFIPGLIIDNLGFNGFIIITALYELPLVFYWWYFQTDFTPNQTDAIEGALNEYYTMYPEKSSTHWAKVPVYSSTDEEADEWERLERDDILVQESDEDSEDEMEEKATPVDQFGWKQRLGIVWTTKSLIASSFTTGITETAFVISMGHFLATHFGMSAFEVGLFAIVFAVGMIIGVALLMPFEEQIDTIGASAASTLFLGVLCTLFGVFYYLEILTVWVCIVLAFGGGVFGAAAQVMISYVPFEIYKGKQILIGTALVGTAYEIGDIIGASITPVVLYHYGFGAMSLISAASLVSTSILLGFARGN